MSEPVKITEQQMNQIAICHEVCDERAEQDAKWGGPEHDDHHTPRDWVQYLDKRLSNITFEMKDARDEFIKIAALAVAAIETIDRKAK